MSNQIVISSGAKVRSLEGVLTGTAGIVNSVPLGGANGVATLDSMGKVPLSQLPASVVTYLGTWNAATNTPTLTNGVGDVGDLYICNVAGTVNFGAGPITFAVGDWVIYNGSQWQKSAGASGTVTSVAVTESGDALTITGSPITTSGTINIGFAGTGSQYIKGDGTLATFPTTIDQAKRLITEVYNSTGATLSKGTVVYINGGQGNLPTVTKAQANADNTSAQTYGVVQSDITNNNNGFVVVIGSLTDIDTQAYAVGTQLYLSGTTAGDWTSTKPSAPIHLVYVGIVVRSHPTQGVVEIRIQNGYELEELHDVAISSPVNNQGIFYNSSNDLWENKSIATALGYTPANDALVVHLAGTETITGAKTFSTFPTTFDAESIFNLGFQIKKITTGVSASAGYMAMYSPVGTANKIAFLDGDSTRVSTLTFDTTGSFSYTFPAINGIVALLEGTQTFTGDKTFNGGVDFNNALNINNTFNLRNNLVGSTLYTNFSILKSGSLQTLTYLFSTANSSKLVFNDAANYIYTFPTTSGTLALASDLGNYVTLATTQTITGAKTIDNSINIRDFVLINGDGGSTNGGLAIKQYASAVAASTGYTSLYARTSQLGINYGAAFNTFIDGSGLTANRTLTIPDASGTIALTSNLSSYVPYTGATSDVNLGTTYSLSANNITAAGVVKSDFGLQLKSGLTTTISGYLSISAQKVSTNSQLNVYTDTGFYFSLIAPNTANYSYTFPASNGTIVLGTGTSTYVPLFNGGSSLTNSNIIVSGSNTAINRGVSTDASLIVQGLGATSSTYGLYATNTSSATNFYINDAGNGYIRANTGIGTNPDAGYMLNIGGTLRVTGDATFSSSITAGARIQAQGSNGAGSAQGGFLINYNANASSRSWLINNDQEVFGDFAIMTTTTQTGSTYTRRFYINPSGNVGIGTSSPTGKLMVYGSSAGNVFTSVVSNQGGSTQVGINFAPSMTDSEFASNPAQASIYATDSNYGANIIFANKTTGAIGNSLTERMRITSGGNVLVGTNTSLSPAGVASSHSFLALGGSQWITAFQSNASSAPYGLVVNYSSASPNSTSSQFLYLNDNAAVRAQFYSNGGLGNYQANNVNLSDERTKKDIIPLESYWDKFKAIEIVKFKYKDQTHDDFNIGVIAQQVEAVAPEFIDIDGWGETPEDGVPLKSVYTADLHHATIKVLQEAMAKIEQLEARIKQLENK